MVVGLVWRGEIKKLGGNISFHYFKDIAYILYVEKIFWSHFEDVGLTFYYDLLIARIGAGVGGGEGTKIAFTSVT